METLHAPWRIQYILAPKPAPEESESLFTRLGRGPDDEANYVVARGKTSFVVLNSFPYNGGHLMVAPYRMVAALEDLTEEESLELMQWAQKSIRVLRRVMKPGGFNVGLNLGRCAGAGIAEHLHLHVVPRWEGDSNFMPVLAGVSVVPEALAETAAKIRAGFADEAGPARPPLPL